MEVMEAEVVALPVPLPADRVTGTVQWFSFSRGYGYVSTPYGVDAFLHRSDAVEVPRAKQEVTFELTLTARGPRAINVQRANPPTQLWPAPGGGAECSLKP